MVQHSEGILLFNWFLCGCCYEIINSFIFISVRSVSEVWEANDHEPGLSATHMCHHGSYLPPSPYPTRMGSFWWLSPCWVQEWLELGLGMWTSGTESWSWPQVLWGTRLNLIYVRNMALNKKWKHHDNYTETTEGTRKRLISAFWTFNPSFILFGVLKIM